MYLWIFKPSKKWSYCGGGAVAIASTFDEAVKLLQELEKSESGSCCNYIDEETEDKLKEASTTSNHVSLIGVHVWVLVENFEIREQTPKVVLFDYNYS